MRRVIWICILILFLPLAFAQNSHIRLLAVSEGAGIEVGQVVDLYLEVQPGEGRIFIDSYPLTRTDTQISTRFANRYACDYANVDCSKLDFIYTIKSNSPTIGGPSASAAIATLTIAKLKDTPIDENIALTGTLNSGGLVGVVGGVKEKILAAKIAGLHTVLIPKGSRLYAFAENDTLNGSKSPDVNWTAFGEEYKIRVIEVTTIDEVLRQFGVETKEKMNGSVMLDPYYEQTMKALAEDLCNQTVSLSMQVCIKQYS